MSEATPPKTSEEILLAEFPDLLEWMKPICQRRGVNAAVRVVNLEKTEQETRARIEFYTTEYGYRLNVAVKKDRPSYLGLTAVRMRLRPTEDWQRGSDLHDGEYSKETFCKIVADIVAYEMVSLV